MPGMVCPVPGPCARCGDGLLPGEERRRRAAQRGPAPVRTPACARRGPRTDLTPTCLCRRPFFSAGLRPVPVIPRPSGQPPRSARRVPGKVRPAAALPTQVNFQRPARPWGYFGDVPREQRSSSRGGVGPRGSVAPGRPYPPRWRVYPGQARRSRGAAIVFSPCSPHRGLARWGSVRPVKNGGGGKSDTSHATARREAA